MFKVKSKLSFPELPFISTQHKASPLLLQTPPFLPFWKAERKRNQLTFWTVVVRSKQSWMILFFIDEKSAIPVNGVLQEEKKIPLDWRDQPSPILPYQWGRPYESKCCNSDTDTGVRIVLQCKYSWLHSPAPLLHKNWEFSSPVLGFTSE